MTDSAVAGSTVSGSTVSGSTVSGSTGPGFEPVAEEFGRLLAREPDARGQFCAYVRGRRVVDLWGGDDVAADDLQGVFSSTKGVSAVCIALLVQRGALDLDAPVSRYWPEFAGGGKADVTVRVALSHQAGLPGLEPQLTLAEVIDHDAAPTRAASPWPGSCASARRPDAANRRVAEFSRWTGGRSARARR